ncbi:MAG: outer membrane protein assembly factor BamD [Pseudomonadota bacterium]
MTTFGSRVTALTLAILMSACSSGPETQAPIGSADSIYDRAKRSMNNGNFREAIFVFEQLESRYPFSAVGKQSQIDLIYCYYKSGSKEQAIDAADQFMRENPTHPRVDYALYIKGLSYFDKPPGPLDGLFKVDRAERPPNDSRRAFSVFRQLVERYPASNYSDDAVQRMVYIKDKLARYENNVADYYLRLGAYIASLNRAKRTLQTYDGTAANEESLRIMIKSYEGLGLEDLAASTRDVLIANFPDARL